MRRKMHTLPCLGKTPPRAQSICIQRLETFARARGGLELERPQRGGDGGGFDVLFFHLSLELDTNLFACESYPKGISGLVCSLQTDVRILFGCCLCECVCVCVVK